MVHSLGMLQQVMDIDLASWENAKKSRVALAYCFEQFLHFLCALPTIPVCIHNLMEHAKTRTIS